MKKIISVFLAVLMLSGFCTMTALADFTMGGASGLLEDEFTDNFSTGKDVTITVTGDPIHKYAVDVEFEALSFTYSTGSTWNPQTHQYEVSGEGTWSAAKTVTIKNHSDLPVWYSASASEEVTTYGTISVKLDGKDSITPTKIDQCGVGTEPTPVTFKVSLEGTPTVGQITDVVISTVTVTIAKSGT